MYAVGSGNGPAVSTYAQPGLQAKRSQRRPLSALQATFPLRSGAVNLTCSWPVLVATGRGAGGATLRRIVAPYTSSAPAASSAVAHAVSVAPVV
jgi:hypothetical protein